ncbi:YibE/F family protein [Pengzhenrongella sicca]|uniref:YibE/F family protein n=1 Tax=Pengzhenrongella sicca TaxID=2819238 RepID=A0A8A4ZJV6_9MICO|nr:YibE/F family protein [Pengzhenrongella sicca]
MLLPLALATIVGLVALWPHGAVQGGREVVVVDTQYPTATVLSLTRKSCEGTSEDRLPDGTVPESVTCLSAQARVTSGDASGRTVEVWAPANGPSLGLREGSTIVLERYTATSGQPETWAWHDFARSLPLGLLAGAFAVVVVAVAGVRGARALIGLALAFVVIATFMLPAILRGENALAVGLVGSSAIMFVVLYLAHGFSRRTTTALLGTLAGLGLTAGLGALAASAAHLSGTATEDGYQLAQLTEAPNLRALFLCGIMLAGLGVLNDVTITQASVVWELRASAPLATRRELFVSGMRIGRDHIASTVYTIAFAYSGAALPVLLLLQFYQLPLLQTLTSGEFAEELVRTLVGSIGLVLAIPLTTLIAAVIVSAAPAAAGAGARHSARHREAKDEYSGHAH